MWAYGVTTVPERKDTYLPNTLVKLAAAGFAGPRLFVDGADSGYSAAGITYRMPRMGIACNWHLALSELYMRHPGASFYALFQDDLAICRNVRQYMEKSIRREQLFWNLYTAPSCQRNTPGWYESPPVTAHTTGQMCRGALALVMRQEAVKLLLAEPRLVHLPTNTNRKRDPADLTCGIDGVVVDSLNAHGVRLWVHNPSLVFHEGRVSSVKHMPYPPVETYPGSTYDAMQLIK